MIKHDKKSNFFPIKGKKYGINLNKFKEICLQSDELSVSENEVSIVMEPNDNGDLDFSSKVEREVKNRGNQQNDAVMYDLVKLMLMSIIECTSTDDIYNIDFGTAFSLNTLISWGIIEELE